MTGTKVIVQGDTGNEIEMLFSYSVNPDDLDIPVDTPVVMSWYNLLNGYKPVDHKPVTITSVAGGVINVTYTPVHPETNIPGRYRVTLVFTIDEGPLTMPTVPPINLLILDGYS